MLATMPLLSTVVVLSLGVGIGVNTVVFSWVQAVLFKPLPAVAESASFHFVEPRSDAGSYPGVSWLEHDDMRERLRSFRDLVAFRIAPLNVGEARRPERTFAQLVSGNFFDALGLRPALGRFIRADETARPGSEPVVVISHDVWQTRFAGATDVLGRVLRANERDLTIVGVAPEGFQGTVLGLNFDLWVPATMAPMLFADSRELTDRSVRGYALMGRLQRHATREEAQSELDAVMRDLARLYPESNRGFAAEVRPFWRAPRGPQEMMASALLMLQGIMLLLLLAVCGNTANLMLARATTRYREAGVRLALGARRWRVVSLLLTENLVLALLGAALGAAIAVWGTNALRAAPITGAFPIRFQTTVDASGLAFAIGLGILCGMVFGLAPALQLSRVLPLRALAAGARMAGRSRMRGALMAAEVALAVVVLIAAALFLESFRGTRGIDPGFRREGVLLAAYDLTGRSADAGASRAFAARLLERLRALPGVHSAAIATSVPLDIHGLPLRRFTVEGRARPDAAPDRALSNIVTPGYLATMGIALRSGTDFADLNDVRAPAQVIINEEFVRRFLDGGEPLGRRVQSGGNTYVVAGVAQNSLYESFSEAPTPIMYFSYRDRPARAGEVHLAAKPGTEAALASELRRVVAGIDPGLPIFDVRTMGEHIEKNLFLRRIPARLFAVLGPLLLLLAGIGIYAVVAYAVAQRTAEIGVRIALGATARRVVVEMVKDTLRVIAAGAAAGWAIAWLFYAHIVPGGPLDPRIFIGVPALLLAVAAAACWAPARRAAGIDPMVALRHE